MSLNFEATQDFQVSLLDVETLISYAKFEAEKGEDKKRELFLKLSVSSLVTKFQVFIEKLLEEYRFNVTTSNKKLHEFPLHLRLNSIKIYSSENVIHDKLSNPLKYNIQTFDNLKEIIGQLTGVCDDDKVITKEFKVNTKFPLGKNGSGEVISLFKQFNGEDIFKGTKTDSSTLDEILWKRHTIIHEDANPQLTEPAIEAYLDFIRDLSDKIDTYTFKYQ